MEQAYTNRSLNRLLANYLVLSMKLFRYQYFVKGAHAYAHQQLFYTFRTNVEEDIENLATFIASRDGKPFATMIKCVKESTLEEATADDEEEEIFEQLIHDFSLMDNQIEEILKDVEDNVKFKLFTFQQKLLEKRHLCLKMRK